jgi:methionyl-tRNA formyltransferase
MMKIQILISKSSWANAYKKEIFSKVKEFSKSVSFLQNHKELKGNYDINIIFSYFKIIPKIYLKKSKVNLIPHESNLPKGKGMSPLTWQILEGKKKICFSLIEANSKIDNGVVYYKKIKTIPKDFLFDEIKKIQLNENLKLIVKFIKFYKRKNKAPNSKIQIGKSTFYKKRVPKNSEIIIKNSILSQFNLLRVVDNKNYPAYFRIYGKKYILKISKS